MNVQKRLVDASQDSQHCLTCTLAEHSTMLICAAVIVTIAIVTTVVLKAIKRKKK